MSELGMRDATLAYVDFLRIGSIANIFLGACLMLSTLVTRSAPAAAISSALVGVLTFAIGLGALRTGRSWLHILGVGLGIWELAALFFFGASGAGGAAVALLVGVMIFSFSCVGMMSDDPEYFEPARSELSPVVA